MRNMIEQNGGFELFSIETSEEKNLNIIYR